MKTERTRKIIIRALSVRKMARPRRIVVVLAAALPQAFAASQGDYLVQRMWLREFYTVGGRFRGVVV